MTLEVRTAHRGAPRRTLRRAARAAAVAVTGATLVAVGAGGASAAPVTAGRPAVTARALVSALPAGLDPRSVSAARTTGWAVDASKGTRMLYLLHGDGRGGVVVALSTPTSFGGCNRDGCFTTPSGVFHVTRKGGGDYRSNQYRTASGRGAAMPWPVFFHGGVAIHQDPLGASHECIHVPSTAQAKTIHDSLPIGAAVVVH